MSDRNVENEVIIKSINTDKKVHLKRARRQGTSQKRREARNVAMTLHTGDSTCCARNHGKQQAALLGKCWVESMDPK